MSAISTASLLIIALMVGELNIAIILAALLGACLASSPTIRTPPRFSWATPAPPSWALSWRRCQSRAFSSSYAIISFAVPFLVLGIPIFDICFAFLRRVAKGQNPMTADRGHVHHRLIDMGFNQKQAVAISYMLTAILGLAAVLLTSSGELRALIFDRRGDRGGGHRRPNHLQKAHHPEQPHPTETEEEQHEEI